MTCAIVSRALLAVAALVLPVAAPAALSQSSSASSTAVAEVVRQARAAHAGGKHDDALSLSRRALTLDPADREAMSILATVLTSQGEIEPAVDAYAGWRKASKQDDRQIVSILAVGALRAAGRDANYAVSVGAQERLAKLGDADAR